MAKVLLLISLCWLFCGGHQFKAEKVWLFSKKQYGGNTPVRAPGQQPKGPTSLLLCFLEIKKGDAIPAWDSAYLNGRKFSIVTQSVSQDSIIVGTIQNTKMPAVIKPDAGYQVINLLLEQEGDDGKAKDEGFVLKGHTGKKGEFLQSTQPAVELMPDMMP